MNLEVIFDKTGLTIDKRLQAMEFIEAKQLRELFESLLVGLLYNRPPDPTDFMKHCLCVAKDLGNAPIRQTTFMVWDEVEEDNADNYFTSGQPSVATLVGVESKSAFTVFNR